MPFHNFLLGRVLLAAGLSLAFGTSVAMAQDLTNVGMARVSDGRAATAPADGDVQQTSFGCNDGVCDSCDSSCESGTCYGYGCNTVVYDNAYYCETCQKVHHLGRKPGLCGWCSSLHSYNKGGHCYSLDDYLHSKFACFCPSGSGGAGSPLIGKYGRVYAVDPQYFDQRDGQLYSAQGYGVPMAVPLAPTVRHTYNYGWGVPSSRLTPVTRIVP